MLDCFFVLHAHAAEGGARCAAQGYPTSINDDLRAIRDARPGSRLHTAISVSQHLMCLASAWAQSSVQIPCIAAGLQVRDFHERFQPSCTAWQMRLAEKETLDATLRFFEERYDRIGQLEFYQARTILTMLHSAIDLCCHCACTCCMASINR